MSGVEKCGWFLETAAKGAKERIQEFLAISRVIKQDELNAIHSITFQITSTTHPAIISIRLNLIEKIDEISVEGN